MATKGLTDTPQRENGRAPLVVRLFHRAPARVAAGLLLALTVAAVLFAGVTATSRPLPDEIPGVAQTLAPERLEVLIETTVEADRPALIEAIDQATADAGRIPGVARVVSPTNALALLDPHDRTIVVSPAFGSASKLPAETSFGDRATLAASSDLGSAAVVAKDGATMAVIAELRPGLTAGELAAAAEAFTRATDARLSPLRVVVHHGGTVPLNAALTDALREQAGLLVGVVLVLPALLVTIVLRRRTPAGAVLGVAGAALLVLGVVLPERPATDARPITTDHPVARANALADRHLQGSLPLVIELSAAGGDFRSPAVLTRVDALASWLRDEYGVRTVGLPTVIRALQARRAGVDSVPPDAGDVDTLLATVEDIDGGAFRRTLVSDDYSTAWLVGSLPDAGDRSVAEGVSRFDAVATAELESFNMDASISTRLPGTDGAAAAWARALKILGGVTMLIAVAARALGEWTQRRRRSGSAAATASGDDTDALSVTETLMARRPKRNAVRSQWQSSNAPR